MKWYTVNSENRPHGLYSSKALFEGLIFGGAYVQREICVSKSIGLALFLKGNLLFFLVLLCMEGRFNGKFFALRIWGAYIWRGLYLEGLIFGILRYFTINNNK